MALLVHEQVLSLTETAFTTKTSDLKKELFDKSVYCSRKCWYLANGKYAKNLCKHPNETMLYFSLKEKIFCKY